MGKRGGSAKKEEERNHSHLSNTRIVHHTREIGHAPTPSSSSTASPRTTRTAKTEPLRHTSQLRVIHQALQGLGVAHEVLGHVGEHGVAHQAAQIRHTSTSTSASATAQHTRQSAEIRHASSAAAASTSSSGAASGASPVIEVLLQPASFLLPLDFLHLLLGRLEPLLHRLAAPAALELDPLTVRLHAAPRVPEHEAREPQPRPRFRVLGVRGDGELGVGAGLGVLVAGAVGGGAVGEVDGVGGGDGDGFGVEVDGGRVVLARHGGVALGFEEFGFRGRGGHGGRFWGVGSGCCAAAGRSTACSGGAGVFAFEFFVDAVDTQKRLRADGVCHVGFVGGVDVEGVGDAGGGYFYAFAIFGCQGAVLQRRGEEIDYGEGETLFGIESGRLVS